MARELARCAIIAFTHASRCRVGSCGTVCALRAAAVKPSCFAAGGVLSRCALQACSSSCHSRSVFPWFTIKTFLFACLWRSRARGALLAALNALYVALFPLVTCSVQRCTNGAMVSARSDVRVHPSRHSRKNSSRPDGHATQESPFEAYSPGKHASAVL